MDVVRYKFHGKRPRAELGKGKARTFYRRNYHHRRPEISISRILPFYKDGTETITGLQSREQESGGGSDCSIDDPHVKWKEIGDCLSYCLQLLLLLLMMDKNLGHSTLDSGQKEWRPREWHWTVSPRVAASWTRNTPLFWHRNMLYFAFHKFYQLSRPTECKCLLNFILILNSSGSCITFNILIRSFESSASQNKKQGTRGSEGQSSFLVLISITKLISINADGHERLRASTDSNEISIFLPIKTPSSGERMEYSLLIGLFTEEGFNCFRGFKN